MTMNLCPPAPKVSRLDGFLLATRRRDRLDFLMNIARVYCDISHFLIGTRRIFLLHHPDYSEEALNGYYESFIKGRQGRDRRHFLGEGHVTSEGDTHRRQRRLTQPALHKRRTFAHEALIVEHAVRLRPTSIRLLLSRASESLRLTGSDPEAAQD